MLLGLKRILDYYTITCKDVDSILNYLDGKPLTEKTLLRIIRSLRESFPHTTIEIRKMEDWEDYILLKVEGDFHIMLDTIERIESTHRADLVSMEGWIQITVI
jgi:hypothetical protein